MMRYWETERREARPALASIKASLLLILLTTLGGNLSAQSFDRKVFSPGGSTFSLNGQEYGFTFGEPIIGTDLLTTPYLTKGFQQPEPLILLPVKVTLHEVRQQAEADLLVWSTSRIEQTSYFEVQLAVGGGEFASFHSIEPSAASSYAEAIRAPRVYGAYRYRISQVMYDGTSVLSSPIEVARNRAGWTVSPVPADNILAISGHLEAPSRVDISLFDQQGKLALSQSAEPDQYVQISLSVAGLAEGIYSLKIEQNGSVETIRVVIIH